MLGQHTGWLVRAAVRVACTFDAGSGSYETSWMAVAAIRVARAMRAAVAVLTHFVRWAVGSDEAAHARGRHGVAKVVRFVAIQIAAAADAFAEAGVARLAVLDLAVRGGHARSADGAEESGVVARTTGGSQPDAAKERQQRTFWAGSAH
jgi:hypothetical protein